MYSTFKYTSGQLVKVKDIPKEYIIKAPHMSKLQICAKDEFMRQMKLIKKNKTYSINKLNELFCYMNKINIKYYENKKDLDDEKIGKTCIEYDECHYCMPEWGDPDRIVDFDPKCRIGIDAEKKYYVKYFEYFNVLLFQIRQYNNVCKAKVEDALLKQLFSTKETNNILEACKFDEEYHLSAFRKFWAWI